MLLTIILEVILLRWVLIYAYLLLIIIILVVISHKGEDTPNAYNTLNIAPLTKSSLTPTQFTNKITRSLAIFS